MSLPEYGSIVIIEDKHSEAKPLINVLSKKGIPFFYFEGIDEDELPDKTLSQVRIIFLDLRLGLETIEKNIISKIINILKRIIDPTFPYIIIAWTKHDEYLENLKKNLIKEKLNPIIMLDLEKNDYFETDEKNELILKNGAFVEIEKKLLMELNKIGELQIFISWENLVHKSTMEIINDFSRFYISDENWNKRMYKIFELLAKSHGGKTINYNNLNEFVKNSLLTFNMTFLDRLENNIRQYDFGSFNFDKSETSGVKRDIKALINKKLLLAEINDKKTIKPGSLYLFDKCEEEFLGELWDKGKDNKYPLRDEIKSSIRKIMLEVSPLCDYAQNKIKVHRVLYGALWPLKFESRIKKADYIYKTPFFIFNFNKEIYHLVFDFRYLESIELNKIKREPYIKLRQQLLIDIQSKISNHIHRPGYISIR